MSNSDVSRDSPAHRSLAGLVVVAVLGAELLGGVALTATMAKSVAAQAPLMMKPALVLRAPGH